MDRNRLQVHISRLRRTLGGDCISTRAGGYALAVQAGTLDADQFERLAARRCSGKTRQRRPSCWGERWACGAGHRWPSSPTPGSPPR
jgi:hypothetical protein